MSVITVFYGQCGIQISDSFYLNLYNEINNTKKDCDYYTQSLEKWFHITKSNKWYPRSVLIDTECKTVPTKHSQYQFKNVVSKACGGSANNWAFGYTEQSKFLLKDASECIRKELERNDLQTTFLNVFSTSGGTGSGVGSAAVEFLRNEYPKQIITSIAVLPYMTGETITQSYNSLLSLAKIYSISDAILLFENDRLHYTCANSLNIKDVNFYHINNLISRQLLSVYQPLKEKTDVLAKLCESPLFKLLQVKLAPLSKLEKDANWKMLMMSVSRQCRFDLQQKNQGKNNLKIKNISTALVCRGLSSPDDNDLKIFKDSKTWKNVQLYHHKRRIFNLENCLSVVSNSNNVFFPLHSILQDACNLYKYGAYVHHYKQFGVDESYFKTSFETVGSILKNYKHL